MLDGIPAYHAQDIHVHNSAIQHLNISIGNGIVGIDKHDILT